MPNRILYQITAPAVVIGVLLVAACIAGAWVANRLQNNLRDILTDNVASLEAAQEMAIGLHRLHFICFLYLIDPADNLLLDVEEQETVFARHLHVARNNSHSPQELALVQKIEDGYGRFQFEFKRLQAEVRNQGMKRTFRGLVEENPIKHILEPCEQLVEMNKVQMVQTRHDSEALSFWLGVALAIVGLGGPVSGIILGIGIARNLRRSLTRLSVRVHDVAERLETNLGTISVAKDSDLADLDAQLVHILSRVEEVTQRMQAQAREMLRAQQLSAVAQLAASIAHEVRNPLMPIKMLVEAALRSDRPRPLTEKHLRVILSEVIRVEKTVQEFLDFSRPPALHRDHHDLRDIVRQALALVSAQARQLRIEVETDLPETPCCCLVDREQLATVLVNLCLNAFDAMPTGGRLRLELLRGRPRTAARSPQGVYRLRVIDTGSGIPPAILEQLFTPFVSSKPTGTGLGLCISRRIVEDHGGRLVGANQPGGGACFTIQLPQGDPENADTAGR